MKTVVESYGVQDGTELELSLSSSILRAETSDKGVTYIHVLSVHGDDEDPIRTVKFRARILQVPFQVPTNTYGLPAPISNRFTQYVMLERVDG